MTATARETAGRTDDGRYQLSHLAALEAEAIHVLREVAAEFERPVLLFSGGKDSIVMLHLAVRAFRPGPVPFPVLHIDTGHNFPEVLRFRDHLVEQTGVRLHVARVQDDIDAGRVVDQGGSRNPLQTVTLLRALREGRHDAAFGGARRDEEKARAKERVYSFRDELGQWDPRNQRPELWQLFNGRHRPGEHIRAFPLSTGPSPTCGPTSAPSASSCRSSTSRTGARSSAATACCCPPNPRCTRNPARRYSRPPCGSAPSAT